jgi:hypothetical protein
MFAGAMAAVLACQALLPPPASLANNGDFSKVSGLFDLTAPSEDEFLYAPARYRVDPAQHYWSGFYSTEIPLAAAAFGLSRVSGEREWFDLRWMGAVHGLLYAAAFAAAAPLTRVLGAWRLALAAAAIVVFGDAMYATMLNTFYMDAAALVFLLLAFAFLARAAVARGAAAWAGLTLSLALLAGAKAQHAPLAAPAAALLLCGRRLGLTCAGPAVRAASALAVLAAATASVILTPASYAPKALYSVIFWDVLKHSPSVESDLAELGLDAADRVRIGTHGYSPGVNLDDPEEIRRFQSRTSHARLGWFFLRHPRRTLGTILRSLDVAGRQRPWMGNFDRAAGKPERSESQAFAAWSRWKRAAFEGRGWLLLVYFLALVGANAGLAIRLGRRLSPGLAAGIALAAVMATIELLVCSLGDAVEIIRHYLLFFALTDLLALSALALAAALSRDRYRAWAASGRGSLWPA